MSANDHSTPEAGPLLDAKQYKSMADALGAEFESIMEEFFESCEGFSNRLDEARGQGDLGLFRNICHEIKGSSGLIGFSGISSAVAAWEATSASGRMPEDKHLIETFEHLVCETRKAVGALGK